MPGAFRVQDGPAGSGGEGHVQLHVCWNSRSLEVKNERKESALLSWHSVAKSIGVGTFQCVHMCKLASICDGHPRTHLVLTEQETEVTGV